MGTSKAIARVAQRLTPTLPEVIAAVESLYRDELKPFGRILRKRIAEQHVLPEAEATLGETGAAVPDVDVAQLRALCEASVLLLVEAEEGGDWSAVFVGRPLAFVDIYDLEDTYPSTFWEEADAYFESLAPEEMILPGGRYSCAQALLARRAPFLEDFSLGQVCRFVQLAITKNKVLGYLNGSVVPYGRSQSMVKERCAVWQQPCSDANGEASGMPLATWEVARACLREILEGAATPQGLGSVPLSNVKRLFRSRFHVELSETMLGHSKLSDLLQDVRFADVCAVRLEGHGYTVVQQTRPHAASPISLADSLPPPPLASLGGLSPEADTRVGCTPTRQDQRPDEQLCHDAAAGLAGSARRGCLREARASPQSPVLPSAVAPAPWPSHRLHWPNTGLSPGSGLSPSSALSPFALSKEGRVGRVVRNTFIHAAAPPPTPPPGARPRSKSLPKDVGSERSTWEAACNALSFLPRSLLRKRSDATSAASTAGGFFTSTTTTLTPPSPEQGPSRSVFGDLRSHTIDDAPMKVPLRRTSSKDATPLGVQLLAAFNSASGQDQLELGGVQPLTLFDSLGCVADRETLGDAGQADDGEKQRRALFCADEPLCLEDAGHFDGHALPTEGARRDCCRAPPPAPAPTAPRPPPGLPTLLAPKWSGHSPTVLCKESRMGSLIQSPSVRSALQPPTLAPSATRRSQSLPKDAWSSKGMQEACSPRGLPTAPLVQPPLTMQPPRSPTMTASPQLGDYGLWPSPCARPRVSPQRVLHLADHV